MADDAATTPTGVTPGDLVSALEAAHAALDAVAGFDAQGRQTGWASGEGLDALDLRRLVKSIAVLEGRVAGLKLHATTLAERAHAADDTAATDTTAWATSHAAGNRPRSWTPLWLADLLETKYHHVRAALASGRIGEEHAEIIVRAAEAVPEGVTDRELADCEERLVWKAEKMIPSKLRRAAKRLLAPISKRLADEHESGLLEEEEQRAERETYLHLADNGDGTWSGKLCISDLHATALLTLLDKLSGPRRDPYGTCDDPTVPLPRVHERRGRAFCELLEHLPLDKLLGSTFSVVVHVEEEHLRTELGAAQLDTGVRISAAEARRLACSSAILPLVLDGVATPLDLGRKSRLFTSAQAMALSAQWQSCAAEGCDRPFSWCELHHLVPWGEGGKTDIANAVPLCGHHHRRIHDRRYLHERLPDGHIRFKDRWPVRRLAAQAA